MRPHAALLACLLLCAPAEARRCALRAGEGRWLSAAEEAAAASVVVRVPEAERGCVHTRSAYFERIRR
jgi:hypothetical protein